MYDLSEFWVEPFFNVFGLGNKAVEDTGGFSSRLRFSPFGVFLVIGAMVWVILSGAALSLGSAMRKISGRIGWVLTSVLVTYALMVAMVGALAGT